MRKALPLLAAIAALTACSAEASDGRDEILAGVMCENFIEDRLQSPGSAEFQSAGEYQVSGTGNDYVVSGYVDAQNAFGALLRADWTCDISYNPADEMWTLNNLTGIE